MNPRGFFAELKRRNVYKVAVAYAVVGWLVMQVCATIVPALHLADAVTTTVVVVVLLGFPVALVLAWAFEVTPEGIKRTEEVTPEASITHRTGRKLITLTVVVVIFAATLLAWQFARRKTTGLAVDLAHPITKVALDKSIAVLPFDNLSEDKANAYFAEGVQDEILTRLAKVADLKVISRTSTQHLKSAPDNLPQIARQLGVANILEGSIQKSADAVRVNVQLIKADGDAHLWAETYDRKLTDIFAVETEVAQRIAASLEARLSGREQAQLADIPTKNPAAYDAYLRGVSLLNQQGFQPLEDAIKYLQSATALDPQYAEAWAQLGIAESQKSGYEHTAAQLDRARSAAETAVRLEPESGETHESLATYYYYGLHDLDRALAEMERARSYGPNNPQVTFYIGLIKRRKGRLDESIEDQRKAATLDPRNQDIWTGLAGTYRGKRDFQRAMEMVDRALAISPEELEIIGYKAEVYAAQGDLDRADELLRGRPLEPGNEAYYQHIMSLLCRRLFDDALAASAQTEGSIAKLPPLMKARRHVLDGEVYALAGNAEAARPILRQACQDLLALRAAGNASTDIDTAMVQAAGFLGDRALLDREAEALLSNTRGDRWQFGLSQQIAGGAYAAIGDADRAMPFITDALAAQCDSSLTVASLRQHPVWDRIRNDPRFQKAAGEQP